jgi:hypothetical protein
LKPCSARNRSAIEGLCYDRASDLVSGAAKHPTKVRAVLDKVNGDDAGALYVAALGGFTGADLGRQQGNHQLLVDGLMIAFLAIAGILARRGGGLSAAPSGLIDRPRRRAM